MPTSTGTQSALEIAAIAARTNNLTNNIYNDDDGGNNYTARHTRALADALTPVNGKGTGNFLDIFNYSAGGSLDINGSSGNIGSGRNAAIALNESTWGFGPDSPYIAPDTSKNVGQVVI